MPFTLKESLIVNKESNLALPLTYNESFNEVTLPTFKLVSINTLPFTLKESLIVSTESIFTRPFTYKLESILAFNVFTFKLILLDSEAVSLSILWLNITDVSAIFNFEPADVSIVLLSLVFNVLISELIADLTNCVLATEPSLLALSAVGVLGVPKKVGESKNLFTKVSILSLVTKVPFVGNIRDVGPVVLNFKFPDPCNSKFLPSVMVLPTLLTPVPP